MRWASAVSQGETLSEALDEVRPEIEAALGGEAVDLVVAFASPHYQAELEALPTLVAERFGPRVLLGCTAAGVIGGGREVELRPALSITAASLPGVDLTPFRLTEVDVPDLDRGPPAWFEALGVPPEPRPHFLVLVDPFTFDPGDLLMGLDFAYVNGSVKLGGLASGGQGNLLFLDGEVVTEGAVGVAMGGNVRLDPIVAQGCRPIGEPMTVTKARRNLLIELDGRRPTDALAEIYERMDDVDRDRFGDAMHIGVAPTSFDEEEGGERPEFLIRNVLGADTREGILAVGCLLRAGQRVQFHVRDAEAADSDLSEHLVRYRHRLADARPAGVAEGVDLEIAEALELAQDRQRVLRSE